MSTINNPLITRNKNWLKTKTKLNFPSFALIVLLFFFLLLNTSINACNCNPANIGTGTLSSNVTTGTLCLDVYTNYTVSGSVTWSNCIIYVAEGVLINIPIGSSLTLSNGCLVTKTPTCSNWAGFYVEGGGSGTSQSPTSGQGCLYVNGAKIEFADLAVFVESGGIIKTDNSNFENNIQDIDIESYLPSGVHTNECEFTQTGFSTTDLNSSVRVNMDGVEGIQFFGCIFENNESWGNASDTWDLGVGIQATDSKFLVSGLDYVTDQYGCFESHTFGSWFQNFGTAITSTTTAGPTNRQVVIEDATFVSNYIGIETVSGEDLSVTYCTFTNDKGAAPRIWENGFKAILINNAHSSTFQNINYNTFETDIDYDSLDRNYFCYARTSGYINFTKNTCTSLDYQYIPGTNDKTIGLYVEDAVGLMFICNEFNDLHHDLMNVSYGITQIGYEDYEYPNSFSRGLYRISNIATVGNIDYFLDPGTTSPYIPIPNNGLTNVTLAYASDVNSCEGCPVVIHIDDERPALKAEKRDIKIVKITENEMSLDLKKLELSDISSINIIDLFGNTKETITNISEKSITFESAKKGFYVVRINLNDGTSKNVKVYIN